MQITRMLSAVALLVIGLPCQLLAQTALPPEVADHGYADMIVLNGKVVSMDDAGLNESTGRIYEAIATKKDRIIALGTSERLRTLAGPKTQVVNLGGRTLIPGIIETHAHLFGGGDLAPKWDCRRPTGESTSVCRRAEILKRLACGLRTESKMRLRRLSRMIGLWWDSGPTHKRGWTLTG